MAQREVIRTYLQMKNAADHRAVPLEDTRVRIERAKNCPASFYRYLYQEVGGNYHWVDRLNWSDQQIREHISQPGVSVWVMYCEGAPAGYFQLQKHEDHSIEIAYFGLLPEFHGQGLGKQLLSFAVDRAWELHPDRVWLHTCTLDDPAAVPNYVNRGFQPYKQETYWIE
jgi:GNAT superfamily N-acetyltransferase